MSPRILDPQEVAVGNPGGQEHIIRAVNIREHPDGFRRDRPLLSHWPPLCRGLEEGAGGVIRAGTARGGVRFYQAHGLLTGFSQVPGALHFRADPGRERTAARVLAGQRQRAAKADGTVRVYAGLHRK